MKKPLAITCLLLTLAVELPRANSASADDPLIDMGEMLDDSTLDIQVLDDWHVVDGKIPTRQKLITIRVGELVPGRAYRVPVRMIVPAVQKAQGFHLTGGHQMASIRRDARLKPIDEVLIQGGVGLVHTMVQVLDQSGQRELGMAADKLFIKTLNPRYSIQYWGWPATLMRSVTAAYAESEHFAAGKIALSGGSKNGATPSLAIIHDKRMTAVHASVSPIWDSPLRLCDTAAWQQVREHNRQLLKHVQQDDPRVNPGRFLHHAFLGGTFGPVYNQAALDAGHSWRELQRLAARMADHCFVTRNLDALRAREPDLLFHPGTHDFVAFDIAWGGEHHPEIPIYLKANTGHGKNRPHPRAEQDEQNRSAWLLEHFFEGVDPLLKPPSVRHQRIGTLLHVTTEFPAGSKAETGRIFWIIDRGPDGSAAYLRDEFPDDNWQEMTFDQATNAWKATIELKSGAKRVDFFSNHRKTISHLSRDYATYLSSPYTRVAID